VVLDAGQSEKIVALPLTQPAAARCQFAIWLDEAGGRGQRAMARTRLTTLDDFARYTAEGLPKAYRLTPDGDGHVASQQTMSIGVPPEGPPVAGAGCGKITYRFEAGWKFVCLAPQAGAARPLEGRPRAMGMWIYGDGTGNMLRVRVVDATGQTFQPSGELMRWKGWRWIQFPLDDSRAGHWGGANDGVVHFPLHFTALLLIDSTDRKKTEGTVYISSPTLVE